MSPNYFPIAISLWSASLVRLAIAAHLLIGKSAIRTHCIRDFKWTKRLIPLLRTFYCPRLYIFYTDMRDGIQLREPSFRFDQLPKFPIPSRTCAGRNLRLPRIPVLSVPAIRTFPRTSTSPQLTAFGNFLIHFIVCVGLDIQVGMSL